MSENSLTIAVSNIGPVREFHCGLAPGVTVLRGKNGAGKTTILRTVQFATDGRAERKPTKADGAKRGEANVAGKTLTVMQTIRTEGDLPDCVSGVGDLSIADLHTPRFDSAAVRDRHRIAALLRLAGVPADATLFHALVGGEDEFMRIVDADALKTTDLVEMAARVKRAIERKAQDAERDASSAEQRRAAEVARASGVDISQPDDEASLAARMTEAVRLESQLKAELRAADEARGRALAAQQRLDALPPPPDMDALGEAETAACRASDFAEIERKTAWEAYQAAERRREQAARAVDAATAAREAAQRESNVRAELLETIKASAIPAPPAEALVAASRAVAAANAAIAEGVRVREAKAAIARSQEYATEANRQAQRANGLRRAAADTASVLSDAIARIPNCPLKAIFDADGDTRLVMATNRSEFEPFDDRSDGERWRTVLDIAAVRERIVVLAQSAWGELSDETRSAIDRMAKERGCYVLTAQADDGELRAEAWNCDVREQGAALSAAKG